jgi:predicted amidohydrolase
MYDAILKTGIVQTIIDPNLAWNNVDIPRMTDLYEEFLWVQIEDSMRSFHAANEKPHIIVFPELTLPRTRISDFSTLAASINAISIIGVDYELSIKSKTAFNRGMIFIPRNIFENRPSRSCASLVLGKTFPAQRELEKIRNCDGWDYHGDENIYIIDCEQWGRIGVSICYDFMDLERLLLYKGRIQHLFVIALNRDTKMFRSIAETISRMTYCNVVVCNSGFYGGSVAISPYYDVYRRTIFASEGNNVFLSQVIDLPVSSLYEAQVKEQYASSDQKLFKDPPPGYQYLY